MKKIIDGKMYNTETAKLVGTIESSLPSNDFNWFREELYQKKTGEFLLYGEGGAKTKYSEDCGDNQWIGGSRIIPLSFSAAQKWTEKHLDTNIYESLFGEVTENDDRKTIGISIAISTHEKAKRQSSMEGISLSEYIENLILDDFTKSE